MHFNFVNTHRQLVFLFVEERSCQIWPVSLWSEMCHFFQVKGTPWEGSSRTVAFIWSKELQKKGRVSYQLMHMSDWLPTLYSAAGKSTSF
jgi:hypothetical protein